MALFIFASLLFQLVLVVVVLEAGKLDLGTSLSLGSGPHRGLK